MPEVSDNTSNPIKEEDEEQSAPTFGAPAPQARGSYSGKIAGSEPKGSGSFVNLEKFIEANKEPTKTMASNVVSTTKGEGEKLTGAIGAKADTAIGGMKAAVPTAINLSGMSASELGSDAMKDYVTVDEEEEAGWEAVPDFSTEAQQADQFNTTVQNTTTGTGLSNLVGGFHKAKGLTATAGQRGFDTMLFQKDPNAQTEVAGLRDWSKQYVVPSVAAAQKRVGDEGAARLKAATDLRDSVLGQAGTLEHGMLNTGADVANQNVQDAIGRIGQIESEVGTTLSPEERYQYVGGSWNSVENLTPQQLATLNALSVLQGGTGYISTGAGVALDEAGVRQAIVAKKAKEAADAANAMRGRYDAQSSLVQSHPEYFNTGIDMFGNNTYSVKPEFQDIVTQLEIGSVTNS